MGRIELTFKSDLCASSGQAFSSIVDSDIATDDLGLPYIPARRIKGCLRDAAVYLQNADAIDESTIKALFGSSGQGTGCGSETQSIKIGNGYLADHEELAGVLNKRSDFPPQKVTELFTSIKAQTAIEKDTVKPGSLRYTRTLSHHLPYGDRGETEFCFDVKGVSDMYEADFNRICMAFRHIGLMRTRGLGAVKATYIPDPKTLCDNDNKEASGNDELKKTDEAVKPCNGKHILPLHIRLTEPLLIAAQNNTACLEYVPGTAVLGAFARLAVNAKWTESEFEEAFLCGKVKFGNLYISDKNGARAVPAPHFIKKLKIAGRIVNSLTEECDSEKDTPKTLKAKCVLANELTKKMDVRTETTYHHSRGDNALLYTQDSISAGQYLYGEIESDEEEKQLLEDLAKLLETGDLRFGRSKTAQYSAGEVLDASPNELNMCGEKDATTVFALESDAILLDENGVNTIAPEELKKALKLDCIEDKNITYDLAFKYIHGYNSKRNLRNIPMTAIAMGSYVSVKNYSGDARDFRIGIRNSEGFGVVRVYKGGGDVKQNGENGAQDKAKNAGPAAPSTEKSAVEQAFEELLNKQDHADQGAALTYRYFNEPHVCSEFSESRLNAAFVGVVSRMIETSSTAEIALGKIAKIKDTGKKDQIGGILSKLCARIKADSLLGRTSDLNKIQLDCMLTLLRLAKYRIKRETNEKKGGKLI